MSQKTRTIIGWVLTAILALVFIGSAISKLTANDEMLKQVTKMGLSQHKFHLIAIIEIVSFLLFAIPRTGLLGTLLLAAYMGGAIATHAEHFMPVLAPTIVECVVFITAAIRFPEPQLYKPS
jgi:uncharacterized membrane protein YphA (DoxX/SURF4 family)